MLDEVLVIGDADQAAIAALKQAMIASNNLTFCVGGTMIDNKSGAVLQANPNRVMQLLPDGKTATCDPTLHGERQLVSWYFRNKSELALPEPRDITVMTTLDPCVMCAGALLTAGFHVGVAAFDTWSGINYQKNAQFETLPDTLAAQARATFGYYHAGVSAADPTLYVRDYQGSPNLLYRDTAMSDVTYMGCSAIFTAGLSAVQAAKGNDGGPPDTLSDPHDLPDDSRIKLFYRELYPNAFKLRVPNWQTTRMPDQVVLAELRRVAGAGTNAVAFIDPFGNVVLCLGEEDGIDTAFMRVTSQYAQRRFVLRETDNLYPPEEWSTHYLTQAVYGAFVYLNAPDPKDSRTIMEFGAYGSTMAGPIPAGYEGNFLYYILPAGMTQAEIDNTIAALPPFYNQTVKMALTPVTP